MAVTSRSDRIAVYAPTGFLGRLVLNDLRAMGARVRLAGRDATRLAALAGSYGPDAEWVKAPIGEQAALEEWLSGCAVVVNPAGTLAGIGETLIVRAMAAGAHYVDAAGEQPFIRRVFEVHAPEAGRAGVALVPAMGLDYAPGDALAAVVARGRQPAREVLVAYAISGADVGANSMRFAAQAPLGHEVFYESGQWLRARSGIYRRYVEFPPPFGRQLMARYGAGEIVTVPRHVDTSAVTALITVRALVPDARLVPFFPYLRPMVTFARQTPLRHLLGLAARLKPQAPSSPPAGEAAPASPRRFAIVVEVVDERGMRARGVVEGGDFHAVTARTLAFGACRLASAEFDGRGALAPAQAVAPEELLVELEHLGVTWRLER
jgi:short subunit dehydrogenase-like uncharacterized protein